MTRDEAYLRSLVHELVALPAETPWLELKHNNANPQELGEYISALANSAALEGKARATHARLRPTRLRSRLAVLISSSAAQQADGPARGHLHFVVSPDSTPFQNRHLTIE